MERENRSHRSGEDGRGRALRRILIGFSARLGKERDKTALSAAWWNEPEVVTSALPDESRVRQAELWEDSVATAVLVKREELAEELPAPVSLHVGAVEKRNTVWGAGMPKKGSMMSPLAIAQFLRIGGSVYDGRDEGRWFDLPAGKKMATFQFLGHLAVSAVDRRAGAASERIRSRRSEDL